MKIKKAINGAKCTERGIASSWHRIVLSGSTLLPNREMYERVRLFSSSHSSMEAA